MAGDIPRRPRRNPLTPEEVADIVAFRKRLEHYKLHKFKRTAFYRLLNVFNIACLFLYMQILFCYAGPCRFEAHRAVAVEPHYGDLYNDEGQRRLDDVEIQTAEGKKYVFVIKEFIDVPPSDTEFYIGRDFILQRGLKGFIDSAERSYRLFAASHILFLSALVLVASFLAYIYNLNENAYSLSAMSVLNVLTLMAILFI